MSLVCEDCVIAEVGILAPGEEKNMGFMKPQKCSVCGNETEPEKIRQPVRWPPPPVSK